MLPPFVPPSARVPSESLPLITEFVVERGAHVAATAHALATPPRAWTSEDETELPSIEEFLVSRAESAAAASNGEGSEAPQRIAGVESHAERVESAVEAGPRPEDQPAGGITPEALEREEGEPIPPAETEILLPPISADASELKESTPPGARFNDAAADTEVEAPGITMGEAWEASASSPAVSGEEAAERAEATERADAPAAAAPDQDEWGDEPEQSPSGAARAQPADAAWVSEERDAFDWQGVGNIAAGPDDARRAEEAWSGTEWETRRNPEHEQVATALVQLARRVRAGEVKVELPANATVEASLAAVLAALLAEEER